jgi:hypothetical protein
MCLFSWFQAMRRKKNYQKSLHSPVAAYVWRVLAGSKQEFARVKTALADNVWPPAGMIK